MTILDISLCLPELDIIALRKKRSIVAVTQRFIVPDRSFALLPCRASFDTADSSYHSQVLADLNGDALPLSEPMSATHWARCVFCQQVDESAIALLSKLTIWTAESLSQRLQNGSLFLSFLRTYVLPKPFAVESEPVCEQLYKFIPLSQHLEVDPISPTYSSEEFATAKKKILEPESTEPQPTITEPEENNLELESLSDADWVAQIAKVGNSSDGHTFEKLVRKALIELGFSNSAEQLAASLNPDATGGASGLDFYADRPYKIVGECKATKTQKINSDAATQLVRLGLQNLKPAEYPDCVKIVVAAGALTAAANQIAEGHHINVLRPETIKRLVESKIDLQEYFDLMELKPYLEKLPFGELADAKVNEYLNFCLSNWKKRQEYIQLAEQIISSIKELSAQSVFAHSQAFSAIEIRAHHNAKYQPIATTSKVETILEQSFYSQNSPVRRRHDNTGSVDYFLSS